MTIHTLDPQHASRIVEDAVRRMNFDPIYIELGEDTIWCAVPDPGDSLTHLRHGITQVLADSDWFLIRAREMQANQEYTRRRLLEIQRDRPAHRNVTDLIPRVMFHVTDSSNLESILSHGLRLSTGRQGRSYPPRVYLSDSRRIVREASSRKAGTKDERICYRSPTLLRVDTTLVSGARFWSDPEGSDTDSTDLVYTDTAIPAAAINLASDPPNYRRD